MRCIRLEGLFTIVLKALDHRMHGNGSRTVMSEAISLAEIRLHAAQQAECGASLRSRSPQFVNPSRQGTLCPMLAEEHEKVPVSPAADGNTGKPLS